MSLVLLLLIFGLGAPSATASLSPIEESELWFGSRSSSVVSEDASDATGDDSLPFGAVLEAIMPRNSTLDQFVEEAFVRLGRHPEEASEWVSILRKNWYSTPEDLLSVSSDGWARMGFPDRLVETLVVMLDETFTCLLKCLHEGTPNKDCSGCDCTGAWAGTLCETYDETIPASEIRKQMEAFITLTKIEWDDIQSLTPLPGRVGVGIDLTSGEEKLPVVSLTYSDPTRVWRNEQGKVFRLPVEAVFKPSYSGFAVPKTKVFPFRTLYEYASQLVSWTVGSSIPSGVFAKHKNLRDVHERYFLKDSLSAAQRYYNLYELELPQNGKTGRYDLHRFVKKAVACLPPDYDTNPESRELYRLFVENYGTSYTKSSLNGGMVEQLSLFSKDLNHLDPTRSSHTMPFTTEELVGNAEVDLHHLMGESSSVKLEPSYESNRRQLPPHCYGGNPEECRLDGSGEVDAWLKSVQDNPVPLTSNLASLSELVPDPLIRSFLQQEIASYVTERTGEIKDIDTCPPEGCSPYGSCSWPAEVCTCKFPGIYGWMCEEVSKTPTVEVPKKMKSFDVANSIIGDVNGDGKTDLLELLEGRSLLNFEKARVLFSNGDGSFVAGPAVPVPKCTHFSQFLAAAGDINGDGMDDMIGLTDTRHGRAVALLSNGNGTFTPVGGLKLSVDAQVDITDMHAFGGDYNGDGMADILRVSKDVWTYSMDTLLSNGDGTFDVAGTTPLIGSRFSEWSFIAGDVNGDNLTDIIQGVVQSKVRVLLSDGNGTFVPSQTITINSGTSIADYLAAAGDINGDGKADLVKVKPISLTKWANYVLLSNGDGSFTQVGDLKLPFGRGFNKSASFGRDFNGDGMSDIFLKSGNKKAQVMLSNGDGTFAPGGEVKLRSDLGPLTQWISVRGDFNGDGRSDVFRVTDSEKGYATVMFAKPDGSGSFY